MSRRLPDTLVIDIVEREPAALWQDKQRLALIDAEGVVLDRVPVDQMPDLPLLIGPGANAPGAGSSTRLMADGADAEAAAGVGDLGRPAPLGPQFPVGRDGRAARRRAARRARRWPSSPRSTGRSGCSAAGIVRFDLRIPGKMIVRLPRAPGEAIVPEAPVRRLIATPMAVPLRPATDRRARHRLVEGQRADRHARRRRAAARARHRPARKPRGQARLHHRHGGERVRGARGGRAGRAHVGRDHRRCLGELSAPAGWSATSPMSRSSLAATRSSSPTSTSCCAAGQRAIDRGGQVVLHAHPALYTIDGVEGVKQPIGLHADRLGVDIHVVAADPAPLRNIDYVIRSAHLGVRAIVASPVAAALACLTDGGARARRRAGRARRRSDQRLAPCRRDAGRAALDPARAPRTSPTTSPAPSGSSGATPSG